MDRKRFSKKVLWIAGSIAVCIFCISAGIFLWNRQSKSQSTVKEKPDEVQEIQNINARDNVAEPDAYSIERNKYTVIGNSAIRSGAAIRGGESVRNGQTFR